MTSAKSVTEEVDHLWLKAYVRRKSTAVGDKLRASLKNQWIVRSIAPPQLQLRVGMDKIL